MTADETVAWLHRLCATDIPVEAVQAWMREPFVSVGNTEEFWTVATNGKLLVALAGTSYLSPTEDRRYGYRVAPLLQPISTWQETLPLSLLRRWAGKPVWSQPCPSCLGTASTSPHVICTFCDGDGTMEADPRPGAFLGESYNRDYFARAIEGLDDEDAQVSNTAPSPVKYAAPLFIEPVRRLPHGQSPWRVAIMPRTVHTVVEQEGGAVAPAEFGPEIVFGADMIDPSWLTWNDGTILRMAQAMHANGDFSGLPVLADALEDAGCADKHMLDHCRREHLPVKSLCWVVDAILAAIPAEVARQ